MTDTLDFFQKYEFAVQIEIPNGESIHNAKLTFGAGEEVRLSWTDPRDTARLHATDMSRVTVLSDEKGSLTLIECKIYDYFAIANYAIAGDIPSGFTRFSVRYTNVSEWFFEGQSVVGNIGESLTWRNPPPSLHAAIRTDVEEFTIESKHEWSHKRSGEKRVIHEHIAFQFDFKEPPTDFYVLREKVLDLACLFGILLTEPLSIASIHVWREDGHRMPVYFPFYESNERDGTRGIREICLVPRSALDSIWQQVLQGYFSSKLRRLVWRRLAGMQRYKGFWEYRILGYVSLLDQMTTQISMSVGHKEKTINRKKLDAFKSELSKLSSKLSSSQNEEVLRAAETAFSSKQYLSFPDRFSEALNRTNHDFVRILKFSKDDFEEIKKLRDQVAHAQEISIQNADLTRVTFIINKIKLLLTWWLCTEIGVNLKTLALGLERSFGELRFHSGIDHAHLAKLTESAQFFSVSKDCMEAIKESKTGKDFPCFTRNPSGEIEFSEYHSGRYRDWILGVHQRMGQVSHGEIFGIADHFVEYIPKAYLESEGTHYNYHSIYIIINSDRSSETKDKSDQRNE